jgi:hypothetical protein
VGNRKYAESSSPISITDQRAIFNLGFPGFPRTEVFAETRFSEGESFLLMVKFLDTAIISFIALASLFN